LDAGKNILICPLDWGLGHASRCIPLIRQLKARGHHLIIAASGGGLALLQQEFPDIETTHFPGFNIKYPESGNMAIHFLLRAPALLKKVYSEHRALAGLIKRYHIDTVISDNRFGLWSRKAQSIFITHQIMIKCPAGLRFFEPLLHKINTFFILKYDACWIPDVSGAENLSGDLSHFFPLPKNARFIGWLSRFSDIKIPSENGYGKKYDVLVILSGPEPQRSIFENMIINALRPAPLKSCVVRGTPGQNYDHPLPDTIDIAAHLPAEQLAKLIIHATTIICRPGYTTLMDLRALKKNAVLVPTPGQTEQEYLAEYLHNRALFYTCRQDRFHLMHALEHMQNYPGFSGASPEGFALLPSC
jgi:uncharacterized protein (TIGR00661 family)